MIYLGNGLYSDSGPDTLAHYGILGMKWGIRKQKRLAKQRDRRKAEYAIKHPETYAKIQKLGREIDEYANKKYFNNPKIQNAFIADAVRSGHSREDAKSMLNTDIFTEHIHNTYLDNDKKYQKAFKEYSDLSEDYYRYVHAWNI